MPGKTVLPSLIVALAAIAAAGQSFTGKITGFVTDSGAAVIPKAHVTVVNEGTGARRELATDRTGFYSMAELPVGYYTVRVMAPGMEEAFRRGVKIDVGGETRIDFTLSVESATETMEVRAQAPVLQQDSSAVAEVVETRQMQELPMNGRDFRRAALLVAGAAPRSPRGSLGSFTADGQREKSNIF